VGPLDFSLLLFCILAPFLAPDFLMWKNIYRVDLRRLLAVHMLGSKELWAISDGLTRVELGLYHPPAFFPRKRALHYRSAPSATNNSFSTNFCARSVQSHPTKTQVRPLASSIVAGKCELETSWSSRPWRFWLSVGHLDKNVSTSVELGLAWNLWQTVWILPLFNLGRKRQSYSRQSRRNPQKTKNPKSIPQ